MSRGFQQNEAGEWEPFDDDFSSVPPKSVARHQLMVWQPIETAPRDGTPVLVAECTDLSNGVPHWYIDTAVNYFDLDVREKDAWVEREGSQIVCDSPTHWMPLPPHPH